MKNLTALLLLLPAIASADPGPATKYLMNDPASMLDIGILKAEKNLNGSKHRVDYVDQLIERGYSKGEAAEAWRTADSGGLNLLRNLQQAELGEEIERLETTINTPNEEGDSA